MTQQAAQARGAAALTPPARAVAWGGGFSRFRLCLSMIYLGALFMAGALIYDWLQGFSGQLAVALHQSEDTLVRPATAEFSLTGPQRRMPLDVISFRNPALARRLFDTRQLYDALRLPFRVTLSELKTLHQPPPLDSLEFMQGRNKASHTIRGGEALEFAGQAFHVDAIAPWSGLLRHPGGNPMAACRLRADENSPWSETLFLKVGEWVYVDPGAALKLAWYPDEKSARAALPKSIEAIGAPRWGIVDGKKITWIASLTPGAGAVLEDNTEVTLLRYEEKRESPAGLLPAILVEFKTPNGQAERHWFAANHRQQDAPVRFQYPRARKQLILLHAWAEGAAAATLFAQGQALGEARLEEGQILTREGLPFQLRLDQVIPKALPVGQEGDLVWHVRLTSPAGELALREGEMKPLEDCRIRYRRLPQPPEQEAVILLNAKDNETPFTLQTGARVRASGWRFHLIPMLPTQPPALMLEMERCLWGPRQLFGALLLLSGAFGMVYLRLRGRPPH